ncbi:hypothetical protein [Prosthecobacter sp.]|uniref:hypothetical protein n=1 Tax=Prosthecobacter sp. TaxID=1965333 RepID=UPI003783A48A
MSDAKGSSNSAALVALIVALPLLYAFSSGPVVFALKKFPAVRHMEDAAGTFYAPMIWLHENAALKRPLNKYWEWWEKLAAKP